MKPSDTILARLRQDAMEFGVPEKRLATLDRLKSACDLIADGYRIPLEDGVRPQAKHVLLKINPSNIDKVVRAKRWSGPTRSFIANKQNGLIDYVNAREEERLAKSGAQKVLPNQSSDLVASISDVETRQAVRREIERRRLAEQELKILKAGLKSIPQIDVDTLLGEAEGSNRRQAALPSTSGDQHENRRRVREFLERFQKGSDLRPMGLKREGADIIAVNNRPVILEEELKAIIELCQLPLSILE